MLYIQARKSYFLKDYSRNESNQTITVELTASRIYSSRSMEGKYHKSTNLWHMNMSKANNHLSTSVSKMMPKSALLLRTAWVIALIAALSSGFGIWFGNIPNAENMVRKNKDPHLNKSIIPWITIWLQELTAASDSTQRLQHLSLKETWKKAKH